jgi:4-methylaminobutanoate oxidase (formaldehyde-forming)
LGSDIDFLGRAAVERAVAEGPRRRLVSFRLEEPDAMLWGGELVLRDGVAAGQVTSVAWSATFGACVGLAYVWRRDREPVTADHLSEAVWHVNVGGRVLPVSVGLKAPFDPANERIRS